MKRAIAILIVIVCVFGILSTLSYIRLLSLEGKLMPDLKTMRPKPVRVVSFRLFNIDRGLLLPHWRVKYVEPVRDGDDGFHVDSSFAVNILCIISDTESTGVYWNSKR